MIGCWGYTKVKEDLWVEDLSGHLHRQEIQKEEWIGRGSNESHVGQVESEMPQRHLKGDVKETTGGKITFTIKRRLA